MEERFKGLLTERPGLTRTNFSKKLTKLMLKTTQNTFCGLLEAECASG